MVTSFGKILRIIRINTGDSSKEMARKLHVSPSYLSAIENGKRNIPYDMEKLVTQAYTLSPRDLERLRESITNSTKLLTLDITLLSENRKRLIYSLAKDDYSENEIDSFCEMVDKNKK
ncbi:MAG: helix-turn-helix transcriptional regulator [Bacilli bacterium]